MDERLRKKGTYLCGPLARVEPMRAPAFLIAADSATTLISHPTIGERWSDPSALPGFTVGGLAEHLAGQVFSLARALATEPSPHEVVPLLEHYARAAWVGADRDSPTNVAILGGGETAAEEGHAALVARLEAAVAELRATLPDQPEDRRIEPPAGPWTLTLDDFLVTRMMEIVVHSDDLACSVDLPTPALPGEVEDPVLGLLVSLAVRRRGSIAMVRALTRHGRAPESITAF
jgi:Mycothiol maleylpyruvate isomerase N-terminal domain